MIHTQRPKYIPLVVIGIQPRDEFYPKVVFIGLLPLLRANHHTEEVSQGRSHNSPFIFFNSLSGLLKLTFKP